MITEVAIIHGAHYRVLAAPDGLLPLRQPGSGLPAWRTSGLC